jgi:hypothetical protein
MQKLASYAVKTDIQHTTQYVHAQQNSTVVISLIEYKCFYVAA